MRAVSPNAIVVNVEHYHETSNRIVALFIDAFMFRNIVIVRKWPESSKSSTFNFGLPMILFS